MIRPLLVAFLVIAAAHAEMRRRPRPRRAARPRRHEFSVDRGQCRAGEQLLQRPVHVGDASACPGQSSCQTIDGVLVDTGSSGLRMLGQRADAGAAAADRRERCAGRGMLLVPRRLHVGAGAVGRHQAGRRAGERRARPGHRRRGAAGDSAGVRQLRRPENTLDDARRQRRARRRPLPAGLRAGLRGQRLVESRPVLLVPVFRMPGRSRSRWRGSCRIRSGCSRPTTTASSSSCRRSPPAAP